MRKRDNGRDIMDRREETQRSKYSLLGTEENMPEVPQIINSAISYMRLEGSRALGSIKIEVKCTVSTPLTACRWLFAYIITFYIHIAFEGVSSCH